MENGAPFEFDPDDRDADLGDGAAEDALDEPVPPELFEQRLRTAIDRLIPIARSLLNRYQRSATMHTTALVSDALLRLIAASTTTPLDTRSQQHLIGSAVLAMRSVLVERARRKSRHKRRASLKSLDEVPAEALVTPSGRDLSVADAVDTALRSIASRAKRAADAVELRFFGDLTVAECGAVLGVSERQANNLIREGKRLLAVELRELRSEPSE